jgi:hypothetical protein
MFWIKIPPIKFNLVPNFYWRNIKVSIYLTKNSGIMKNLYIQYIAVVFLLSMTHFMYAQDKFTRTPVTSQNEFTPVPGVQPVATKQNSIKESIEIQLPSEGFVHKVDTVRVPLLQSAPVAKTVTPSYSTAWKSLTINRNVNTGFTFDCVGAPLGLEDSYATSEGQVLMVAAPGLLANDIDPDGDAIIVSNFFPPTNGTLTSIVTNGSFSYVPNEGFIGTDQFQYTLLDADGNYSDPVTVNIQVFGALNRKPIGISDHYGTSAGISLVVSAPGLLTNDLDPDGDFIIVSNFLQTTNGTITSIVTNGSFIYVPNEGFVGTDQFQYTLLDADGNYSDPVVVTIEVLEPFNRKPIGISDTYGTTAGTSLVVNAPGLLRNDLDPDGDVIIVSNFLQTTNGTITSIVTNGSFVYVPDDGFVGTDQFQYTLLDAEGNYSDPVTVTLEVVAAGGDLPLGFEDNFAVEAGQTLTVSAPGLLTNDFDPNGDNIIVSNFIQPTNGTLTSIVTNGSFVYVPDDGFTGTDQFQYTLLDTDGNFSDPVIVTIEVLEKFNRKPIGITDHYATSAGTTLVINAPGLLTNDLDPDGDFIIVSNFLQTTNGTLTSIVTNGSFTYVPDDGFTGTDQFQYTLLDADGNYSDPVTVTIEVFENFNRKPIGISDSYGTPAGTSLVVNAPGLLTNDFDPDGDIIIVSNFVQPTNGTLTSIVTNGSFVYVPDDGFVGTDQFQYILLDAEGNYSDPVIVTLEVVGMYELPVASAADLTTECEGPSGTTVTLDGSASTAAADVVLQYTWYENGIIIAGPSALSTAEVILSTGTHIITLIVEDECGNTSSHDATIIIEDSTAPLVEAAFLPTNHPNGFEISCSAEDLCSDIVSSFSVIRIPDLINPKVSLKNQNGYSLEIDTKKNTVSVKAPDAAAFWAMIMANGGVEVINGQVIKAKYDKNKYKYGFDAAGNLLSADGNEVTLRCTATDSNGNTGEGEATLPSDFLQSLELKSGTSAESGFDGDLLPGLHRNYPNPFKLATTIEYELQTSAFVKVSILDQNGRMVRELSARHMPAGVQQITWDATHQQPGIYFYRITYNEYQLTGKILLLGE